MFLFSLFYEVGFPSIRVRRHFRDRASGKQEEAVRCGRNGTEQKFVREKFHVSLPFNRKNKTGRTASDVVETQSEKEGNIVDSLSVHRRL